MLNIDVLTLGNPFKDDEGNEWKVTSNWNENTDKIHIEIEKIKVVEELIDNTTV